MFEADSFERWCKTSLHSPSAEHSHRSRSLISCNLGGMLRPHCSQALVTTVLGLTVAIPTLLMHQLVQSRAKQISELLEQEAVALVAITAGNKS